MALFSDTQYEDIARYCLEHIRYIREHFGDRPPGSEGEYRCQEYLARELEAVGLTPEIEAFPVAQKAFMAVPAICSALALIAALMTFVLPSVSPIIAALAFLLFGMEIILYRHVLTPFSPKHTSHNLHAVLKPKKELRQRLIFGGHADAAYEWRYQNDCPALFMAIAGCLFLTMGWIWVGSLARNLLFTGEFGRWIDWTMLPAAFIAVIGLFFTRFSVVAGGAVDNLSGALLGVALARALAAEGLAPDHTEIIVVVNGSEEAGLCGAKNFVARHRREWRDVPTAFIALDSFRDLPHFAIFNRDLNGTVRHNPQFCALLREAGRDCGRELPYATVTVGSSDAAAFAQAGIPAALLCAMDPKPAYYYHTRRDDWPILDKECLREAARVVSAAIDRYDKSGADKP